MTTPTPPRTVTLYVAGSDGYLGEFAAHLVPVGDLLDESLLDPPPGTWTITHGIGGLGHGTYSEVRFAPTTPRGAVLDTDGTVVAEHVRDQIVREVAVRLYGTAWAFHYRPEQYVESVARYALRRREVVVVDSIELYA